VRDFALYSRRTKRCAAGIEESGVQKSYRISRRLERFELFERFEPVSDL
jgi:hypothetical protein